jgi:hypothetical protein
MQMHNSGTPLVDIRAAIEAKYTPTSRTMTPTPPIKK